MIIRIAGYLLSDAIVGGALLIAVLVGYRILLAKSGQLNTRRALLMGTLIIAPLIMPLGGLIGRRLTGILASFNEDPIRVTGVSTGSSGWMTVMLIVYGIGTIITLGLLFAGHVRSLILLTRAQKKETPDGVVMVSKCKTLIPFCWMGRVVVGSSDTDKDNRMVLIHERVHASRYHWIDLLIAGVVAAINWFNPAVWVLLEELKRVHEYQADRGVIESGIDSYEYQILLIKSASPKMYRYVVHGFTGSALRSRIEMMIKTPSRRRIGVRVGLVIAIGLTSALAAAGSTEVRDMVRSIKSEGTKVDMVDKPQPQINIDGKPARTDELNKIDPNTIESITVVKSENDGGTINVYLKH